MADRIMLRIRHLLPFPLSFRLTAHIPKLVPSFLGPYTQALTRSRSARLHATSYLDGLRGLAALIVCMCHYTETNHPNLTTWYGVIPNPALAVEPSLIQLPFIRVTFSGRPVVHVFFVISGFALSVKALSAIRAGDLAKCHATLASAAFRRPLRLCVPPVVSMVLILFFVRAGWLGGALGSWKEQIYDWVDAVYHHIIWPWSWDTHLYPPYNVNLWTIPIELCHSMLLFVMVLALSHVRATVRVTLGTAFVVYSLQCGKWAAAEFISGMLLAEAHLVSTERKNDDYLPFANTPPNPDTRARTWFSTLKRLEIVLHLVILTAALFIAGWPNMDSAHTPVIRRLASYAPQAFNPRDPQGPQKFWFAIGAAGIVWSCGRVGFLRETILKSRFAKYAGRVSFAVYIVHGPVFHMFQDAVLGVSARPGRWVNSKGTGLRGWIGIDTAFHRTLCWAAGFAILFPPVLVAVHLFCRFVDEPLVQLARALESWVVSNEEAVVKHEMDNYEHVENTRVLWRDVPVRPTE